MNGRTFAAMKEGAKNSPAVAERVKLYLYRAPEELYDFSKDPNALRNLAAQPEHQATLLAMRRRLHQHLQRVQDPVASRMEALTPPA